MSQAGRVGFVAVLAVLFAAWTPSIASAGEQWVIEIQRYLDAPEQCPSPHGAETYSHTDSHSHADHYSRADIYGRSDAYSRADTYDRADTYRRVDSYDRRVRNNRIGNYGDRDDYSEQPYDDGIQNSALLTTNAYAPQRVEVTDISCLQGTRVARQYGFHHIEVVSCDDHEVYVYEALRGRLPWRILVDRNGGQIVQAQPLN